MGGLGGEKMADDFSLRNIGIKEQVGLTAEKEMGKHGIYAPPSGGDGGGA